MTSFTVCGVGVLGPGLPDWPTARQILCGERAYSYQSPAQPNPDVLPANERRRSARTVRWAVAVAQEAVNGTGLQAAEIATVFASSDGDGETVHYICETLTTHEREVSPIRFHNSVHNAPAGYWSIAAGSHRSSASVCGYDATFGVGLLEAAMVVAAERIPVLLVAYDIPYPLPLLAVRSVREPFAVSLLLAPGAQSKDCIGARVAVMPSAAKTPLPDLMREYLGDNPAAQALPLLAGLASGAPQRLEVKYLDDSHLAVDLLP